MNRTFVVAECAEDEFGQWAIDGVTGEQGNIYDERSCFWTWDDNKYAWQSTPFTGRQLRTRKGKGQGKGNSGFKRTGRAFLGEEQAQDPEWWSEKNFAWWSRNEGFQRLSFQKLCQCNVDLRIDFNGIGTCFDIVNRQYLGFL